MTPISNRLSLLRSYLSLSQASFAEPLGLSPTHIARFEKGVSSIPETTITLICTVFGVDPRYFEDGVEMDVSDAVKLITEEERNRAVAARLKSAREHRGWSQNELAKRFGVGQSIINRIEFGGKLTEKQGRKLAETLEVGYQWLMQGIEERKIYPADERLITWLWKREDVRAELWKRMVEDGD